MNNLTDNITPVRRIPSMPDVVDQSQFAGRGKPSLADRAEQWDKHHCDAPENLLEPSQFTNLDRANLIRTAKAIEELRDIFKQTARIEISNSAMHILERLPTLLDTLNRRLEQLEKAILGKQQPKTAESVVASQAMTKRANRAAKALEDNP